MHGDQGEQAQRVPGLRSGPRKRSYSLYGILLVVLVLLLVPTSASADSNITVLNQLNKYDVYIAPPVISSGHAVKGDAKRLQAAVDEANKHGVPAKVALVTTYPSTIHGPEDGANHLRAYLDFSGVLVLVTPHGVGISSDYLSTSTSRTLQRHANARCASSYTACAIEILQASVPKVKAEQATANRNVAVFWAVAVVFFGALVAVLVFVARRRQGKLMAETGSRPADDAPSSPAPEVG